MNAFLAALRKEVLEQWRTYRVLVAVAVLLAFGLTSPLLAKFTPELFRMMPEMAPFAELIPEPSLMDAIGQYLKNSSQFGVILALLLSMGVVAQEKERGTAAMMLVKPLPRWAFLAAKFAALALTLGLGLLLASAGAYYYTWLLFEPLDLGRWLALNGLLLVMLLVYVALTLLASTLMRSQVAAAGLAFAWLIVLALLGAIPPVAEYLPGQLLAWGGNLFALQTEPAWPALWVSLGLIAAALAGAYLALRGQEL